MRHPFLSQMFGKRETLQNQTNTHFPHLVCLNMNHSSVSFLFDTMSNFYTLSFVPYSIFFSHFSSILSMHWHDLIDQLNISGFLRIILNFNANYFLRREIIAMHTQSFNVAASNIRIHVLVSQYFYNAIKINMVESSSEGARNI